MRTSASHHPLYHIDGLRAVSALVVYVNHAYAQTWNPMVGSFPEGALFPLRYLLAFGHFAVSIFIAISGFCLALPTVDKGGEIRGGVRAFLFRRARRILPPYYAALILCLVLIGTFLGQPTGSLWDVPIVIDKTGVASHFLMLQDLFGTGRINYVFWSIAVEWHIYFLFPLLLAAGYRYGWKKTLLASFALGYALSLGGAGTRIERANPHYLGIFFLGMLAAEWSRAPERAPRLLSRPGFVEITSSLCLAIVVVTCIVLPLRMPHSHQAILDLFMGYFAFSWLLLTSSENASQECDKEAAQRPLSSGARLRLSLSTRPLVWLGTFSYSFYLVHAPILQIVWLFLARPLGLGLGQTFAFLMSVGLLATVMVAYGFFYCFERPFLSSARIK